MKKILAQWLLLAFIVTAMSGLVYAAVQQDFRQSANDPQIEVAQDVASALSKGADPQSIGSANFDLTESLSPFIIVYDKDQKVLANTATLDGQAPVPPKGVFDYVSKHNEDHFTWQPKAGVREAAVMVAYKSGNDINYVLAGRSLTEIEKRESKLGLQVFVVWAFTLIVTYAALWLLENKHHKKIDPLS